MLTTSPSSQSVLIENGGMGTSKGFRQVAITPSGEVRAVQSVKRHGYVQNRCTKQIARVGDYVFRHDYYPHKNSYFKVAGGKLVELSKQSMTAEEFLLLPPVIQKWLEAVGIQESYIPSGFGWDGMETVASKKKEERIRRLFKDITDTVTGSSLVERFYLLSQESPRDGLPTSWNKDVKVLPKVMDYYWDYQDDFESVKEASCWILWHRDGKVQWLVPDHTVAPKPMPKTVRSAIHVRLEPYRRNGNSYGISWTLHHANVKC